ncbi:MAG: tRNA pseudouridine(38-40) synthase TruA [Litorimonas sp.]
MSRFKLTIEYDGGPFQGWQRQDHAPTVQGALEDASARLNGAPTTVYGSGRTDSGVHALAQIAHVDFEKTLRADQVRDALNFHLQKHPISVLAAEKVDDEFHARFDAIERRYLYRIVDRRPRLALDRGRVWRIPVKLDADAMHEAAQVLIGKHDFSTFRDGQCQAKSPIKTLDEANVLRAGPEIHLTFRARSFLHKQVRSFTGSLVEVGLGKWDAEDMQAALDARDRTECGPVASPDGLYLVRVIY